MQKLITDLILAKTQDMDPDEAAKLRKALEEDKRNRYHFKNWRLRHR